MKTFKVVSCAGCVLALGFIAPAIAGDEGWPPDIKRDKDRIIITTPTPVPDPVPTPPSEPPKTSTTTAPSKK